MNRLPVCMYRLPESNKRRFGGDERGLHDWSSHIHACLPDSVRARAKLKRIKH